MSCQRFGSTLKSDGVLMHQVHHLNLNCKEVMHRSSMKQLDESDTVIMLACWRVCGCQHGQHHRAASVRTGHHPVPDAFTVHHVRVASESLAGVKWSQ